MTQKNRFYGTVQLPTNANFLSGFIIAFTYFYSLLGRTRYERRKWRKEWKCHPSSPLLSMSMLRCLKVTRVDSRTVRNSHSVLSRRRTKANFPRIPKYCARETSNHAERWKRNEWKAWNVASTENKRTVKYLWADGFRVIRIAKRADKSQKNWKTGNTCGKNSIRVQWGSIPLTNPRTLENSFNFFALDILDEILQM